MANKRIFETLIKTLNVWSTKIVPTLFCTFNREPEIQQNARAFGSSMAERQPKSLRSTNAGFSTILLSTTLRFYYILSTKNTFYKAYLTEKCSNNPTGQLFCTKNLLVERDANILVSETLAKTCNSGMFGQPKLFQYCEVFHYFATSIFRNNKIVIR